MRKHSLLIIATALATHAQQAAALEAEIVRSPFQAQQIKGLELRAGKPVRNQKIRLFSVKIEGTLPESNHTVVIQKKSAPLSLGRFHTTIGLPLPINKLTVLTISPRGRVQRETILVSLKRKKKGNGKGKKKRKGGITLGLGSTYMNYQESLAQVNVHEILLTPKFSAFYEIVADMFEISANTFASAVALAKQPDATSRALFWAVNAKVAYILPWHWGGLTYKVNLGYYFWTMRTDNRSYGVDLLSGPQMFLSIAGGRNGGRFWYSYIKHSPISDAFININVLNNREIAIGGGVELFSIRKRWHIMMTLDVSDSRFSSPLQGNGMRIDTVTLGLQSNLF